jgi:hypothetical protein
MRLSVGFAVLSAALPLSAATLTVTNTNDSGAGSLRQAILDANASPGADAIAFAIPGADPGCDANGVCTIQPLTNLPDLTETVTIDGFTQSGAPVGAASHPTDVAPRQIMLSGIVDTDFSTTGLAIGANFCVIRGLAIGLFDYGIRTPFVTGTTIAGCFIGTDAYGVTAAPNGRGISGIGATDLQIGSADPADRCVVSGNSIVGIDVFNCIGTKIMNNLIGTVPLGTSALGNAQGIAASGAGSITVGGSTAGAGNVISGNAQNGLYVTLDPGGVVVVEGNYFGTDVTGTLPLGNTLAGIRVGSGGATIGGINPGEGNVIWYNGTTGVSVDSGAHGVTIEGNSIDRNGWSAGGGYETGIDLGSSGVTANDDGDGDAGGNNLQNFPIVSGAWGLPGGGTQIQGVLHSTPNAYFELYFYENDACIPVSHRNLQGRTYLGWAQVTTDANGTATYDVTLTPTIADGAHVSATATDDQGNTSEFSQPMARFAIPVSGPASGGTAISVGGTDFMPGATVTIGGVPATDVNVVGFTGLSATTAALSAGTLNDLVVTNTDGSSGTLEGAFVADFLDVPNGHPFYSYVTSLAYQRITAGIGGGYYGVDLPVSRQQMAVFLLKAKYGACYTPPPCTVQLFADVPCDSPFAPWINQLVALGITAGCGGGDYCPLAPVTRQQMAALLLRTLEGPTYNPPDCTDPSFDDVPCSSPFARWIYELVARAITAGCGNNMYCPMANNTRGQMAVFLGLTFGF